MSKSFGLSYIYWLELQYSMVNEGFGLTELCEWNGNVPLKFFDKFDN